MNAALSNRGDIEITPTLVIGLGGTGMNVLSLFKEKILTLCGPDAPVAFLGIDSAQERLPGAQLTANEFAMCDCILAPQVVRNLKLYPDIERWWFDGHGDYEKAQEPGADQGRRRKEVQPGEILNGAKMKRFVGRLACYYNFASRIRPLLEQHIHNLKQLAPLEAKSQRTFQVRNTIRVYVVGSMSGGTGGGFFYDVAIAVRDAVQRGAGVILPTFVAGVILMPRAFRPHVPLEFQKRKVGANFYAGLREIEYLHHEYPQMATAGSKLEMSLGERPMVLGRPPFDWIYLVDTLNEKGQNMSMSQVWSMIASNLCLEVYSSLTSEVEQNVFVNIPRPTPYGSFATASLRVPVTEIQEYCALRCAKEVLEDKICRARPEPTEIDEANRFLASANLFQAGSEILSSTLLQNACKDRKTTVQDDIPSQNAAQSVFIANNEWEDLQSGKNGLPAARDAIGETAAAKIAALEKELSQRTQTMLNDPSNSYGLEFLIQFSRLLEKEGLETSRLLNEQAAKLDTTGLESQIPLALNELRDAVDNPPIWVVRLFEHGRGIQRCYQSWSGTVNAWALAHLRKCALIEAAKVFQRLQELASRIKASLKQIAEQLDKAAHNCSKDAKRVAASLTGTADQHVLVTNIIGPEKLDGIYAEMRKEVQMKDFLLLVKARVDRSLSWVNVRLSDLDATIQNELLPAIRKQFRNHVRSLDLFSAAAKYWDGTIEGWVKAALDQCSPFCNWNPALVPANVLSWTCIGVEDAGAQTDLLGNFDRTRIKVASTGDPYEIVIHSITAGYPASAVTGLGKGQEEHFYYEYYCQKAAEDPNEHVHVDRRWLKPDGTPDLPVID